MKTETPRTDAEAWEANGERGDEIVSAAFARQLERENVTLVKTLLLIASKEAVKPDVAAATILRELGELS